VIWTKAAAPSSEEGPVLKLRQFQAPSAAAPAYRPCVKCSIVSLSTGLSHRTSFGEIMSEGRRPDERPTRPTAGGRHERTVGWSALADGPRWTAAKRHAARHSIRRTAWRTAIQPPVAHSDHRLDGGRPLRPSVGVAVGRQVDGRVDGQADPSAWAIRPAETLEPHNY
jgi:hypothetical protein